MFFQDHPVLDKTISIVTLKKSLMFFFLFFFTLLHKSFNLFSLLVNSRKDASANKLNGSFKG